MGLRCDQHRDVMVGHDFPGVCGPGMHDFTLHEVELGARVALALDTEDQAWWELELNLRAREDRNFGTFMLGY